MTYQINNAIIGYPGNTLLDHVSMEIRNTEKIAIVGRNGCGKTTLLKVIAGKLEVDNLDSDEDFFIHADGKPTIGYLEQISFEKEEISVYEELLSVYSQVFHLKERMKELEERMETDASEEVINEYGKVSERFEKSGGYTYQTEIEQIFTKFGFTVEDLQRPICNFSGGQKTKIAFVELLLSKPDIMLLDEPTNHLDMETIEWLEGYLKGYHHAVVIVSHDRLFLDHVVDITYEIEYKKMKRYVGNYTAFLKQKRLDYEQQCKAYELQQKEIQRLETFIEKWKNTPTKVAMTRSKRMMIEHMVKVLKPMRFDERRFHTKFVPHKESATEVLNVNHLKIGYDEELSEVSFSLRKGNCLAIIGENGKGKSTLLKTLVGQVQPLGGDFKFGRDVEWVYFDQELLDLDESKTIIEEFWDTYPTLTRTEVRTILGNFLFTEEEVFQPLSQLSGGEKVRLSLAKVMNRGANLIILDEPTNHLDMACKDALEQMLREYTGTILFVSHDRYFINALADSLLIFEKESVSYYPYSYEYYNEKKNQQREIELQRAKERAQTKTMDCEAMPSTERLKQSATSYKNNPQREEEKRLRRLAQVEKKIEEQEQVVKKWKLKYSDPEIAADFEKLGEFNDIIVAEEEKLDALLMEWAGLCK